MKHIRILFLFVVLVVILSYSFVFAQETDNEATEEATVDANQCTDDELQAASDLIFTTGLMDTTNEANSLIWKGVREENPTFWRDGAAGFVVARNQFFDEIQPELVDCGLVQTFSEYYGLWVSNMALNWLMFTQNAYSETNAWFDLAIPLDDNIQAWEDQWMMPAMLLGLRQDEDIQILPLWETD